MNEVKEVGTGEEHGEKENGEAQSARRPKRVAAMDAQWKTRLVLDSI